MKAMFVEVMPFLVVLLFGALIGYQIRKPPVILPAPTMDFMWDCEHGRCPKLVRGK